MHGLSRKGRREAFTGEGAGEVLSGVRQVRGADVLRPTEGNTAGVDIAAAMYGEVFVLWLSSALRSSGRCWL